ncbi:MAG: bifunctional proline dehydrogenase/L-glutamate gamma-semialdehyde dehydrogenase, partial [Pseudomonadota bacterium]
VAVGNTYVNRNQIGAVVGTQPFGGEGLSGTGPKAGGPFYPARFRTEGRGAETAARDMPGPTGETNRMTLHPRAPFLCLGPGAENVANQRRAVQSRGGVARDADGMAPDTLTSENGFAGALWWGDADAGRTYAQALAARDGPILPLITGQPRVFEVMHERHLCVDTTASGGNAALLADVAGG